MTMPPGLTTLRVGLVQLCSGSDINANMADATRLITEAARAGATYVLTPEVTTVIDPDRQKLKASCEPEAGNALLAQFVTLARHLKIWLHVGSMAVRAEAGDKLANRSFLITPDGLIAARYDKIHMFDVTLPDGEVYKESTSFEPGSHAVVADVPWGRLGLAICYDVRFPSLFRALAHHGATMITVPAAFTVPTGTAHWHTLLRARAIETQTFVLAAAQAGTNDTGRRMFGHSLVVGPWGEILAEGDGQAPGVIMADLDLSAVAQARARVPSLTHDRPFDVVVVQPQPMLELAPAQ